MDISIRRVYKNTTIPIGSLERAVNNIGSLEDVGKISVTARYKHGSGIEETRELSLRDLSLIQKFESPLDIIWIYGFELYDQKIYLCIQWHEHDELAISTDTHSVALAEKIMAIFEAELQLQLLEKTTSKTTKGFFSAEEQTVNPENESTSLASSTIELKYPEKITIRWLIDHLPVHLWVSGLVLLMGAFLFGFNFGQSSFYIEQIRPYFNSEQPPGHPTHNKSSNADAVTSTGS